ncbi:bifunctional diaminohydroxyphosphoribosylaminopyrimidine deaminase/5-amino-6-(5-phosphoribosylamino)uracil reductase RibD [Phosphitispora fastidiosa]|uniref:bifunctional diaminohydroxyphosphoribosylaminopyrimidine deaminase/5-amino-6-(5-phosphoribosylamino)uracil reductase RibD n=1 Tax=Phosphitispora fastidiosa TaxID=2837202 RepID=UPI001E4B2939|nr:bifunctional diaminohydroxyphosphoribosylaminopyrimidine deaminase/5-amino-6-(5-phosphoribosylamino)uracil reductase RibD [Phosphitispora fastidiosa]MBU7006630.1 diaminohydroxyphosphoribosylaminopyrimidine deaminase/5-amino-6-(5-phosphoribosylamino)uracil reductase [Phosphitispora fastidiosa]
MYEQHMRLALQLAERAAGRTSPNPLVGAVIVKDGQIVGQGYHKKAGTPHAEIHALREAGENARGGTLYVTLEPCSHYGRTPPCSEAVINAGIREVYVAMEDPNPLVAGRGIKQMVNAGIRVYVGLLEQEAKRTNEIFIKYITTGKPFILLKTAMTLDGRIATRTGHSKWVTAEPAREMVHRLRNQYDGILVGVNTVIADNPALTCRLAEGGRDPVRIVLDSRTRTPAGSRVLTQDSDGPTFVVVTDKASIAGIKSLAAAGAKLVRTAANAQGRVDLHDLVAKLGEMEITGLLVEGGAEVAASFLEAGLVDKMLTFIAPKVIGGKEAPGPVGGAGIETMDRAVQLKRVNSGCIGEDFFIEGYPVYENGR